MPSSGPEYTPQIAFASANLAPSPAMLRSASFLGDLAREADFDGVEMHPLIHSAAHVGEAAARGDIDIISLHQSFRTTADERETFEAKGGLQARLVNGPAGRLLLPNMAGSAVWMSGVQEVMGERLPGVFYPQPTVQADRRNLGVSDTSIRLFQPTDEVARLVGANTVGDLLRRTRERGYDRVCLDTFHAQRRYGSETPGVVSNLNMTSILGNLAAASSAVHLSLNRNDIPDEPHIETRRDLEVLLNRGEFVGQTADIMAALKEQGRAIRHVVIELTLGGLAEVTGHKKLRDHQQAYLELALAVRSYFALAA